jgi:hypothetical protein
VRSSLSKRMCTKKKNDRALPECRCGMVSSGYDLFAPHTAKLSSPQQFALF